MVSYFGSNFRKLVDYLYRDQRGEVSCRVRRMGDFNFIRILYGYSQIKVHYFEEENYLFSNKVDYQLGWNGNSKFNSGHYLGGTKSQITIIQLSLIPNTTKLEPILTKNIRVDVIEIRYMIMINDRLDNTILDQLNNSKFII